MEAVLRGNNQEDLLLLLRCYNLKYVTSFLEEIFFLFSFLFQQITANIIEIEEKNTMRFFSLLTQHVLVG